MKIINFLIILLLLNSCANTQRTKKQVKSKANSPKIQINKNVNLDRDSKKQFDPMNLEYSEKHFNFWIHYFTERNPEVLIRFIERGEQYRELIEKILMSEGLPKDLYYVAMIESGFNLTAKSHASAVGPWQFIKGTGQRYQLKINNYVDERQNIYKATKAAAKYFKDLYNRFGSWDLALSAYNSGEFRVIRAITKAQTRSYLELSEKQILPKETILYVPKFAAMRYLSNNRDKLGINIPRYMENDFSDVQLVKIKNNFNQQSLSRTLGISYEQFSKFNADLKQQTIRASAQNPHVLILPNKYDLAEINFEQSEQVAEEKIEKKELPKIKVTKKIKYVYRVKKGDTLHSIARKFQLTLVELKKANSIKKAKIVLGQKLDIPNIRTKVYVVKEGDNLHKIARQFKATLESIISLNSMKNKMIYPSQKLIVPVSDKV